MIRRQICLIAIAAALPSTALSAHAAGRVPHVKTVLQSIYDRENAAAANRDARGMIAYVSSSFVGVDAGGKRITYRDLADSAQQLSSMAASMEAGTVIRQCRVVGNRAVARVDDEVRIVVAGNGQPSTKVDDKSSSTDTWTMTRSGWMLTASRTIAHKVTINGQPASDIPGM